MKRLLMSAILLAVTTFAQAQTKTAAQNKQRKAQTTTPQQRGTGQYHGARDTTPGSPMGTGGAGGGEMSGSPAGSAIETRDQTDRAKVQPNNQQKTQGTTKKSSTTTRKKGS